MKPPKRLIKELPIPTGNVPGCQFGRKLSQNCQSFEGRYQISICVKPELEEGLSYLTTSLYFQQLHTANRDGYEASQN